MDKWIEALNGDEYTTEQKCELNYTIRTYSLSPEKLKILFNPALDSKQIGEIRAGMLESSLSFEQVKLYARPEIDWASMWELRKCLLNGMDQELVAMMIDSCLSEVQIKEIFVGFKNGVTAESLKKFVAEEKGMREYGRC